MNKTEQSTPSAKRLSRKMRYGTTAAITIVIVIAAILLLNVLADTLENRFPLTVDLTADGTYTLSEESIKLAESLDKDVQIVIFAKETAFTSPSTSSDVFNTILSQFYNTLQQYRLRSGGRVSFSFVDLDNNPTLAASYQTYGVAQNDILFLCGDRFEKMAINDLYTQSADYTTYTYTYTSEVERTVATKINLVSTNDLKTAAMLSGHGEAEEFVSSVTAVLSSNGCRVDTLDITASEEPTEDTDVFVIVAPTADYSDEEIARIRSWLDNGGHREKDLLVFTSYRAACPNLCAFLNDEYGIEVGESIVCETDGANVYNRNPYYTYADIASTDYTADLTESRVLSVYTRPLTLHLTDSAEESNYSKPLVTFGETARLQSFASAYGEDGAATGQDSLVPADEYPIVGAAYTVARIYDNNDNQYYTTNVMVFGSEDFLYSSLLESLPSAQNEALFLNAFRGLTGINSILQFSSRSLTQDTLDFGDSVTSTVLTILFIGVLPVLMIVLAIAVFLRRRRL